jgi:endonuclease/exonuclease/phosphatase family metal-dependent hydrolase
VPPGREAFLEEMVELGSADHPDILCLQELPVWALSELEGWSGMTAVTDVAQRPTLGPLPSTAGVGRVLTDLNHGLLRSAFSGQGNAILLDLRLQVLAHRHVVLNPLSFRRYQGRRLGLGVVARLAWGKERRVCQAVRVEDARGTLVIGNLHATGSHDMRLPDAEVLRAAAFVDGLAEPGEGVLLCGDFNVDVRTSRTLADLCGPDWGFSGATPTGIDHVLSRGLRAREPERWPAIRRTWNERLLSDHAPVEREAE